MSKNSYSAGTPELSRVLDLLGVPAFLLDVDGPGDFRFAHISKRHQQETGIDGTRLVGRAPHQVLPKRMADTIIANYERCRRSGVVQTYDETLELPTGPRWWRTTLAPVFAEGTGGEVVQILGVASDITQVKSRELNLTEALSERSAAAEKLRADTAHVMLDAQEPMRGVLSWLDILRDGFLDLGEGKLNEIDQLSLLVGEALSEMEEAVRGIGVLKHRHDSHRRIDLAHMCRDLAALVDPTRGISMSLPSGSVEADWAVTQIVLRSLLEHAAHRAVSSIALGVEPHVDGYVAYTITDDSAFETSPAEWLKQLSATAALVKERGGTLTTTSSLVDGAQTVVCLPGRLVSVSCKSSDDAQPLAQGAG